MNDTAFSYIHVMDGICNCTDLVQRYIVYLSFNYSFFVKSKKGLQYGLKVHKNENFFGFEFEFCPISLLVMHK